MAYVISEDCVACGTCIDECPSGAISEGDRYSIDPNSCVDCGTCADVCPSGAIAPGEKSSVSTKQQTQRLKSNMDLEPFFFYRATTKAYRSSSHVPF